jgi:hypothetical protein
VIKLSLPLVALLLSGCASTAVDMNEPRRIVGTEELVRVNAQVTGDEIRPGSKIPITYEVTNMRPASIAIAELVPVTTYDAETHTFTVTVGSEVPGNELLPRLVEIAPGATQTFHAVANINGVMLPPTLPSSPQSAGLRLKVNFLGDTQPFRALIGIPERAVADSALADTLFPLWLERNEIVYTNSVPMRWGARKAEPVMRR